jgi:hypothetical protein
MAVNLTRLKINAGNCWRGSLAMLCVGAVPLRQTLIKTSAILRNVAALC